MENKTPTSALRFKLIEGDCLDHLPSIEDGSIDLVLCDLPFGTTLFPWDEVIDPEALWAHYRRILSPTGTIILFGSQPFTTSLIVHGIEIFRHSLIWEKNRPTGFIHAKNKPMKIHEDIVVFSNGVEAHEGKSRRRMTYNPQGVRDDGIKKIKDSSTRNYVGCQQRPPRNVGAEYVAKTGYPLSILKFAKEGRNLHPTQKPVALLDFLIRSYSNEGDLILDNCMGSGSTGVAALAADRPFIGMERDKEFFELAQERISALFHKQLNRRVPAEAAR